MPASATLGKVRFVRTLAAAKGVLAITNGVPESGLERLTVLQRVTNGMAVFDVVDAPPATAPVVAISGAGRARSWPLATLAATLGCLANSWLVDAAPPCATTVAWGAAKTRASAAAV